MSYQNLKLTVFLATLLGGLLVANPSYALKEAESPIKNADITAEMTALKINGIFESSQADAFNDIRDILQKNENNQLRSGPAQKAELKVLIKDLEEAWKGNIKPTDFVKLRKGGVSIKDWLEIVALGKDQKDREYAFPDTVMDDVIAYKKLGNDMKDIKKFYAAYGKKKSYATIQEAMNDPNEPKLKAVPNYVPPPAFNGNVREEDVRIAGELMAQLTRTLGRVPKIEDIFKELKTKMNKSDAEVHAILDAMDIE